MFTGNIAAGSAAEILSAQLSNAPARTKLDRGHPRKP